MCCQNSIKDPWVTPLLQGRSGGGGGGGGGTTLSEYMYMRYTVDQWSQQYVSTVSTMSCSVMNEVLVW